MKRFTQCLLATMMLVLAFGMTSEAAVKKVKITAPTTKKTYTVYRTNKDVSKKIKVNVTTTSKKDSKKVTFKSNKPSVVSVDKNGKFKAKKAGTATITVASAAKPSVKAKLKIKVVQRATKLTATTEGYTIKNKKTISVAKGKNITVKIAAAPEGASNKVTWKTSNKKVATVKNGKITAKKTGSAKITATAKDGSKKKITFTVKVVAGKVTGVSVDKNAVALVVGGTAEEATATVKATVKTSGKNPNKTVVWSSSNEKVATVKDGKITAVAPGTAKITVKAIDGTKKKATVAVTVTQKPAPQQPAPQQPSTPSTPEQPKDEVFTKTLTANTAALTEGLEVTGSNSIVWNDAEKTLATLNEATADFADYLPSKIKTGVNVVANGKAYTLKFANGTYSLSNGTEDIILPLLKGDKTVADKVVIANTASEEQVKSNLKKAYDGMAVLGQRNKTYDFGSGKVTVDGKVFNVSSFVVKGNKVVAVVDGANVEAYMTSAETVVVTSNKALDDTVKAVEAILGGVFTAK